MHALSWHRSRFCNGRSRRAKLRRLARPKSVIEFRHDVVFVSRRRAKHPVDATTRPAGFRPGAGRPRRGCRCVSSFRHLGPEMLASKTTPAPLAIAFASRVPSAARLVWRESRRSHAFPGARTRFGRHRLRPRGHLSPYGVFSPNRRRGSMHPTTQCGLSTIS